MKIRTFFLNKPILIFSFLLIFSAFTCAAQTYQRPAQESNPFWSQVRFGGSLGLNFGNGFFTGVLAPSAIYDFNRTFSLGAGISGAYASQRNFKTTSFGGSIIGMARPIQQLQLSAEYEQLNINRRYELDGGNRRDQYWVPALFLGIGYNAGPVVTGVRYDVLHGNRSFYANAFMPFVSIYF